MSEGPYLPEDEWSELLREIHYRQVIPIVGPELVTVTDPTTQKVVPLYQLLATSLADALAVTLDPAQTPNLNTVATRFLAAGGTPKRIYSELAALLQQQPKTPSSALRALARVSDFDLFLAGTIDPFLACAMELERPGFRPVQHVRAFNYHSPLDLPDDLGPGHVYHIVGSPQTLPFFAVWDEDFLVFIRSLIRHETQLKNLYRHLGTRYLLFLGTPFTDWIVRLFLFVVKNTRFTDRRRENMWAGLADRSEVLGEPLILFFDQAVGTTRIIRGDPAGFVTELAQRWSALYGPQSGNLADPFAQIPDQPPLGAVFISYSWDDLPAVANLIQGLRTAGIPFWLDKNRLRGGKDYELALEDAVKNGSSVFLSLISRATESDGKRFVHRERRWAAQRHVKGVNYYFPVIIDDTDTPQLEPKKFAKIQYTRLPGGAVNPDFITDLTRIVDEKRGAGQTRA